MRPAHDISRLESIEHHGFADIYRSAPTELVASGGIDFECVNGVDCFAVRGHPNSILWNHAAGLGREHAASESNVDIVCDFFERHGVQGAISLTPDAEPSDLSESLVARGFASGYAWRKFTRDVSDPPQRDSDLRIEKIDRSYGSAFGAMQVEGFSTPQWFGDWLAEIPGLDNWHCFMAFDGDTPAATGALYVEGNTGWLTFGATLSDFRRRGAQGALLSRRIGYAAELGCTLLVTETGEDPNEPEPSYRNILRAGFKKAYLRPNFVRSPRTAV